MKITIRQLQVFDAVASQGSVSRAAAKLNMSQSAASSTLTDLQIVLGRPLFVHAKGRPLQITDEGKRLRPAIRSILGDLAELESGQTDAPLSGKLVIGATAMIAESVLPRLCIAFMEIHPGVQIHVESDTAGNLFGRLARFDLETALVENHPEAEGIELVNWHTDELVLVVASGHPLAKRKNLTIGDLANHPWCTREADSTVTTRLRFILHQAIGAFHIAFSSTSNWAVRHAVIAGGGIGCLSKVLVQYDLDNGRLVELNVADFRFTRSLNIARPKALRRSRLVAAFDEFLLANDEGE